MGDGATGTAPRQETAACHPPCPVWQARHSRGPLTSTRWAPLSRAPARPPHLCGSSASGLCVAFSRARLAVRTDTQPMTVTAGDGVASSLAHGGAGFPEGGRVCYRGLVTSWQGRKGGLVFSPVKFKTPFCSWLRSTRKGLCGTFHSDFVGVPTSSHVLPVGFPRASLPMVLSWRQCCLAPQPQGQWQ